MWGVLYDLNDLLFFLTALMTMTIINSHLYYYQ